MRGGSLPVQGRHVVEKCLSRFHTQKLQFDSGREILESNHQVELGLEKNMGIVSLITFELKMHIMK